MAGKDLSISVLVQDGASAAFKKIGQSAKSAAQDVASGSKEASQSVKQLDDSLDKASGSARDFESSGQKIGLGLAGLTTAFTMYSRGVVDNERNIATLSRTYGDAAQQFVDFANQLQSTTQFSNDQAVEAANIMGTLSRNYGLTTDQIKQLIQVSADLAAVNGLSLTDAAERVQAAIRGEGESAEALGLTMNQAAIDADNLTLTMSNAEAGQFRFNALMDQTAFSVGAAADVASSGAGKWQQYGNQLQDLVQQFVQFTGPVGQAAAGISSFGLEAGIALGGLTSLAKGIKETVSAAGGMKAAFSGVASFIGPGGFIALGLGVAAVAAIKLSGAFNDDLSDSFNRTRANAAELDATIGQLATTMSDKALALDLTQGQQDIDAQRLSLEDYKKALDALNEPAPPGLPGNDPTFQAWSDRISQAQATVEAFKNTYGDLEEANKRVEDAQNAYNQILNNTRAGADEARQSAANLFNEFERSAKTPADFEKLIVGLQNTANNLTVVQGGMESYEGKALAAADATQSLTTSLEKLAAISTDNLSQGLAKLIDSGAPSELVEQWKAVIPAIDQVLAQVTGAFTGEQLSNLKIDLADLITNSDPNTIDYVMEALNQLSLALNSGAIDGATYAAAVDQIVNITLPNLQAQSTITGDVLTQMGVRLDAAFGNMQKPVGDAISLIRGVGSVVDIISQNFDPLPGQIFNASVAQRDLNDALDGFNGVGGAATKTLQANRAEFDRGAVSIAVFGDKLAANDDQLTSAIAQLQSYRQAAVDALGALGQTDSLAGKLDFSGISTPAISLSIDTSNAVSAINDVFNAVIKGPQSIAQMNDGIQQWADELINVQGQYGKIDDLRNAGIISQSTYNNAQRAYNDITEDNADIQEDLLRIQVKQAPLIAQMMHDQAAYIDSLADADPELQRVALGYMDSAESAKAFSAVQLAANAALGGFEGVASKSIAAAAEADPVLKAMLEDMGLISVGANGEITVNFDNADSLNTAVSDLTDAIQDLTIALNGVPSDTDPRITVWFDGTAGDSSGTVSHIDTIRDHLGLLGGTSASPSVTLIDNASAEILAIRDLLGGIPTSVVTTLTTVHQDIGPGSIGGISFPQGANGLTMHAYANGGTMADWLRPLPAYAGGGTHGGGPAIVGEVGPEMIWLPNGSQVTPSPASKSRLKDMDYGGGGGDVNFYGPVTLQPAADNTYAAIRRSALASIRR